MVEVAIKARFNQDVVLINHSHRYVLADDTLEVSKLENHALISFEELDIAQPMEVRTIIPILTHNKPHQVQISLEAFALDQV